MMKHSMESINDARMMGEINRAQYNTIIKIQSIFPTSIIEFETLENDEVEFAITDENDERYFYIISTKGNVYDFRHSKNGSLYKNYYKDLSRL